MDLVHDVDAIARLARDVVHPLAQLPDVVDTPIRGGVDLHLVERGPGERRAADRADIVGLAILRIEAVERAEEDAREAGLSCSAWPGQQVRVADSATPHRVTERAGDVLLAHDLGKA